MKKTMFVMAALAVSVTAFAAEVNVNKAVLGSGAPMFNASGMENAKIVDNSKVETNILHSPQYLPYHPTAATIWPRVVEVPCTKAANGDLNCDSYRWNPAMGRAEYLFITPKVVEAPKPVVTTIVKEVPVVKEVIVEVERKKKKE